jgi:hypothetical protein
MPIPQSSISPPALENIYHGLLYSTAITVLPSANPSRRGFAFLTGGIGDRVAKYAGEQVHQIVRKQPAFDKGDYTKALQDGFIATDTALSEGIHLLLPLERSPFSYLGPETNLFAMLLAVR